MRHKILPIICCVIVLGLGAMFGWKYLQSRSGLTPADTLEIPEWYYTDKDGDLISDDKEQELGTNKNESDTDGDMIADRLEIELYKTDPLKSDTDGDGYLDGFELLQGYDPLVGVSE